MLNSKYNTNVVEDYMNLIAMIEMKRNNLINHVYKTKQKNIYGELLKEYDKLLLEKYIFLEKLIEKEKRIIEVEDSINDFPKI